MHHESTISFGFSLKTTGLYGMLTFCALSLQKGGEGVRVLGNTAVRVAGLLKGEVLCRTSLGPDM